MRPRIALAIALVPLACGDGAPPKAEHPKPTTPGQPATRPPTPTSPDPGPVRPAPPALLAAPRLDLTANHVRFHLYDRGLVIPVAGEGMHLYDLDYKRPWGEVAEKGGEAGRGLRGKAASLTVPWVGGAGTISVRARGTASIKLSIDGKAAGSLAFAGDGWSTATLDLPAALAAADHKLVFTPAGKGAAIASVELVPATGAGTPCAGEPLPRAALADGALGGWPRMTLVTEIPAAGYLVVAPAGGGPASITAVVEGEPDPRTLWSGTADGAEQTIDLAPIAGKLVELAFTGGCAVRWGGAAIAVAARDVAPAAPPAKNLILVVVDTLRADRVAAMAETRVETPRLSALAARGFAFRRHQSMAPSSPPSHASIHTGQIPRVHGIVGDDPPLSADAPVLARVLGDAGFWTGYVGDNDFAMGRLKARAGWKEAHTPAFEGKGIDCVPVFEGVVELVKKARAADQRYFITALPIQPHAPYRYHEGITEKYFPGPFPPPLGKRVTDIGRYKKKKLTDKQWDQYRGLYDGEVTYVDSTCYAVLEDGLAALGALEDTAIVVTSDHGEGMGENGNRTGHAYSLNRELIEVPLIVAAPGLVPRVIDTATSAADVAPTVLDLLGVEADPRMQGASLLPLGRTGDAFARVVASEYGRAYALRGGRWRYMVGYDDVGHLYDIEADPTEVDDIAGEAPLALRYLRDAAGLHIAHRKAWRAATWGTLANLAPGGPLAK
jgi:arylsulfatase A-like enzyme